MSKAVIPFDSMKYVPIDMKTWLEHFDELCLSFTQATTVESKIHAIKAISQHRDAFDTMKALSSIRYSIDTRDAYYEEQEQLFDSISPKYQEAISKYYQLLVQDPLRIELEAELGVHLFNLATLALKTFSPEIIDDLELENALSSQYTKLRASVEVVFENKVYNIPQMGPFLQDTSRERRKEAHLALEAGFANKQHEFDQLYDKLVQVRNQIAEKLGFQNFTELAYARLNRSDYGPSQVAVFRDQVLNTLVNKLGPLYKRQMKRLGVQELKFYDLSLDFLSGNAMPKGDVQFILEKGRAMYADMSPETAKFFQDMLDGHWMDLEAKTGKAGGGYCSYIPNYRAPFIFSNFNGTMGDIDVLTHEAGHAFQVYQSRDQIVPEYLWPTLEACEIHSMSMEFLTYPYMHEFFKEDTDKYFFSHMLGAILFIPYGTLVDHFQHWVYENPNVSAIERRHMWRQLEKQYLPHKDYDGIGYLEDGGFWHRQGHIFSDPFYYIDYTLASVCAFQFWMLANQNRQDALERYGKLCSLGGSQPFTSLVNSAGLSQPFEQGTLERIADAVLEYLNGIDDTKF